MTGESAHASDGPGFAAVGRANGGGNGRGFGAAGEVRMGQRVLREDS